MRSGRFWLDEVVDLNLLLGLWFVAPRGRGEVVANERERTREKACEPDNSRGERVASLTSFSEREASRESRA